MEPPGIETLPPTRRALLEQIKRRPSVTIGELAETLSMSPEGVRQQILQLQKEGWVCADEERAPAEVRGVGRPAQRFSLTTAGDHLFPKHYDALTIEVIDSLASQLGGAAVRKVLESLVQARVERWGPKLARMSLQERVEALKNLYVENDPHMAVEAVPGGYRLIERNCAFLNVALARPALCSVTLNTLSRLLGIRVVREERFQDGHGRCVFLILADRATDDLAFRFEHETAG